MDLTTQILLATAGFGSGAGGPVNPFTTPARYAVTTSASIGYAFLVNLQNQSSFNILSSASTGQADVYQVAIDQENEVAYVIAYTSNSITSIDISDKNNISKISTYTSSTWLNGPTDIKLDTENAIAYIANSIGDSISSIDISNPASMTGVGRYQSGTNLNGARTLALDLVNGYAFVSASDAYGLASINISDPANLTLNSTISGTINGFDNPPYDIAIDTDTSLLYVTKPLSQGIVEISYSFSGSLSYSDSITDLNFLNPKSIVLDPTTGIGYCTSTSNDSVIAFSMSNLSVVDTITNSSYLNDAWEIAIDYSRDLVFVTSNQSNYIASVDIATPSNLSIEAYGLDSSYNASFGIALYYESF